MPKRKSAVRDGSEGDLTRIVTAKWFGYNPVAKAMLFAMVVGEMMLSPVSKPRQDKQDKQVQVEYAGSGIHIGSVKLPCVFGDLYTLVHTAPTKPTPRELDFGFKFFVVNTDPLANVAMVEITTDAQMKALTSRDTVIVMRRTSRIEPVDLANNIPLLRHSWNYSALVVSRAASDPSLELCTTPINTLCAIATRTANVDVIECMMDAGSIPPHRMLRMIDNSVDDYREGVLGMMKHLVPRCACPLHSDVLSMVERFGDLELIQQVICRTGIPINKMVDLILTYRRGELRNDNAVYQHSVVMQLLPKCVHPLGTSTVNLLIQNRHLGMLKSAQSNGTPIPVTTLLRDVSDEHGNASFRTTHWLCSIDFDFDEDEEMNNYTSPLDWAGNTRVRTLSKLYGCETRCGHLVDIAVYNNRLQVLKFFHSLEVPMVKCDLRLATERGHLDIVEWMSSIDLKSELLRP